MIHFWHSNETLMATWMFAEINGIQQNYYMGWNSPNSNLKICTPLSECLIGKVPTKAYDGRVSSYLSASTFPLKNLVKGRLRES